MTAIWHDMHPENILKSKESHYIIDTEPSPLCLEEVSQRLQDKFFKKLSPVVQQDLKSHLKGFFLSKHYHFLREG